MDEGAENRHKEDVVEQIEDSRTNRRGGLWGHQVQTPNSRNLPGFSLLLISSALNHF